MANHSAARRRVRIEERARPAQGVLTAHLRRHGCVCQPAVTPLLTGGVSEVMSIAHAVGCGIDRAVGSVLVNVVDVTRTCDAVIAGNAPVVARTEHVVIGPAGMPVHVPGDECEVVDVERPGGVARVAVLTHRGLQRVLGSPLGYPDCETAPDRERRER